MYGGVQHDLVCCRRHRCPLQRGRAGADRFVHGPGCTSPRSPSCCAVASGANDALLGGSSLLCGRAGAVASCMVPAALPLPAIMVRLLLPTPMPRAARWRPAAAWARWCRCPLHGTCRSSPCLPSQCGCCCRRRCRAARWRPAAVWARWCRCLVHGAGRPSHCSPSCCAATAVTKAVLLGGGRCFCLGALVPITTCMLPAAPAPLAVAVSLLLPSPVPRCSVAARCCVGAPVPLPRAWCPAAPHTARHRAVLLPASPMPCCPVAPGAFA